ncbi:mucin-5AC-like [Leptidea sinapis]|uniref:mucin-5AC-like n=1 Tax=Leptidea sinapis TaxID=189913 RepID=UPI002146E6EB|nr:mucin-5AC-like [Leptidea sinapis]
MYLNISILLTIMILNHSNCTKWPDPSTDQIAFVNNPIESEVPGHFLPVSILKKILEMRVLTLDAERNTIRTWPQIEPKDDNEKEKKISIITLKHKRAMTKSKITTTKETMIPKMLPTDAAEVAFQTEENTMLTTPFTSIIQTTTKSTSRITASSKLASTLATITSAMRVTTTTPAPTTVASTTAALTTIPATSAAPLTIITTTAAPTTIPATTTVSTTVATTTAAPTTIPATIASSTTVATTTTASTTIATTTAPTTTVAPTTTPKVTETDSDTGNPFY